MVIDNSKAEKRMSGKTDWYSTVHDYWYYLAWIGNEVILVSDALEKRFGREKN